MGEVLTRPPQLYEESEALLGTPFLLHPEHYELDVLQEQELGMKQFIYRACCRIFADVRNDERPDGKQKEAYNPSKWNEAWELTLRKVGQIAFSHEKSVNFLSRQLGLLHQADAYLENPPEIFKERLDEDQQLYARDLVDALHRSPRTMEYRDEDNILRQVEVAGVTAIAPTGFGKSRLIEAAARMFGVGKPLEYTSYGARPCRMVLVAPSIIVQNQLARGLQEALPELTIGRMSADVWQPDADIVIPTIDTFNTAFEDNHIAGRPVDLLAIDEVHHLAGPQFKQTVMEQWHGMLLGFTATPEYDLTGEDVRSILPYAVEHVNMMDLIDKGRLNEAQIYTFLIDTTIYDLLLQRLDVTPHNAHSQETMRKVIDALVVDTVKMLVKQGRRGMIFCEQGGEAKSARRLAEQLSSTKLADGAFITAASIDSYSGNRDAVIADYAAGNLQVITTVNSAREGFDADVDFVILNTNVCSFLRGHQIIGRGTRKSERFGRTIYIQFAHKLHDKDTLRRLYSIEDSFGAPKAFEQGRVIRSRAKPAESKASSRARTEGVQMADFPDLAQIILAYTDRRPIGKTFAGRNHGAWRVKPGMVPLSQIIDGLAVSAPAARAKLRAAGHPWRGQYEKVNGESQLVIYYAPEARAYLETVVQKGRMLTREEAAAEYNVSLTLLAHIEGNADHGIRPRRVSRAHGAGGSSVVGYDEVQLGKIGAIIKAMPGTQPGDQKLLDVAARLKISKTAVMRLGELQYNDRFLVEGAYWLTKKEIDRVKKALYAVPEALPGELHRNTIADEAGVYPETVDNHLTPSEHAQAMEKRYVDKRGHIRFSKVWPADTSKAIVARLRDLPIRSRQKLPAHLIPSQNLRRMIKAFNVTPAHEVAAILAAGGFAKEDILLDNGSSRSSWCLSWPAVAHLVRVMGAKRGRTAVELHFDQLPTGPEDRDPQKIAYAQQIQALFFDSSVLQSYDRQS